MKKSVMNLIVLKFKRPLLAKTKLINAMKLLPMANKKLQQQQQQYQMQQLQQLQPAPKMSQQQSPQYSTYSLPSVSTAATTISGATGNGVSNIPDQQSDMLIGTPQPPNMPFELLTENQKARLSAITHTLLFDKGEYAGGEWENDVRNLMYYVERLYDQVRRKATRS
ncbi:unnamed protein product [Ambrosiozyma monospora]|uniref:Unnamed protein product n=1 Tax=Ambrosiozyma monospora TaxID=43982 RepID=A0ACB5T748_AMBMO|nr:unnamed protein product [Ambrosiozyma monospora]